MKTTLLASCGALFGALLLSISSPAHASLADCGNIRVEANAECEVTGGVECTADCDTLKFEAACSGELEVGCRGECSASATASCTATCQGTCVAECTADPGSLNCQADCEAHADADCSGKCSAMSNAGGSAAECQASCKATYSAQCSASCTGTPPSASCEAKCQGSCQGSCKADVNVDCQARCQANGYASCRTRLEGGCNVDCESEEGRLVCDGNYVDYNDNLAKCKAALKEQLNVTVTGSASGSCMNGMCSGEAEGSASCAVGHAPRSASGLEFVALGVAVAAGLRRRRR